MSADRIKERAAKLLNLARRGVGGERHKAEALLHKILDQYGLTLEDLGADEQPKKMYVFKYKGSHEKALLLQIVAVVLDVRQVASFARRHARSEIRFELTAFQYAEVDLRYSAYIRDFRKQVDNLLTAFIQKNHLFPTTAGSAAEPEEDSDQEQDVLTREDAWAIAQMMAGMQETVVPRGALQC